MAMDKRAQAIADLLYGGSKTFQAIVAHVHGPGNTDRGEPARDVDKSLQRLRRVDVVHHAGRMWHYGPKPLRPGEMRLVVDSSTSVTFSSRWLENYEPEPNSGCWLWTGPSSKGDYGQIKTNGAYQTTATRAFYAYHHGPIPEGLLVCHKCDTPQCVNPDHLFLGTNEDNFNDMIRKGRGSWQKAALQHRGDSRGGETTP